MKAIRTYYNGILFRSKLEAQWAKFFDKIGIKWIYEPEGYTFADGTQYLPDFYLPESDAYFEVKGIMNDKDMHKIEMLIKESSKAVIIGEPDGSFTACNRWWDEMYNPDGTLSDIKFSLTSKDSSLLNDCPECHKKGFLGNEGSYECPCCGAYDGDHLLNLINQDGGTNENWKKWWRSITYIDVRNRNESHEETLAGLKALWYQYTEIGVKENEQNEKDKVKESYTGEV